MVSSRKASATVWGWAFGFLVLANATAWTSAFAPQPVSTTMEPAVSLVAKQNAELRRQRARSATFLSMADGEDGENFDSTNEGSERKRSRMVWFTGFEDLRVHDHGGLMEAFAKTVGTEDNELIIPVFTIDPEVHLRSKSASDLKRLHGSLTALERELAALSLPSVLSKLVVQVGPASERLPAMAKEMNAIACHVVEDDVANLLRISQKATRAALEEIGVEVHHWSNRLRPSAPWSESSTSTMPSFFPDYCEIADALPIAPPVDVGSSSVLQDLRAKSSKRDDYATMLRSEGIPSLSELFDMAESVTPRSVVEARAQTYCDTTEPFETLISEKWSTGNGAKKALKEYCLLGNDEFTNKYFIASDAANKGSLSTKNRKSMYAMSIARVLKTSPSPKDALALREGPTRTFSSALTLGAISAKEVLDVARNRAPLTPPVLLWDSRIKKQTETNRAGLFPSDNAIWGRNSEGSLSDVIEWREWFHLLAQRSLALQESGKPATSGGEKLLLTNENNEDKSGDSRESGTVNYWRWKGQHLVRYLTFPAGKDYYLQPEESRDPAILLVHGFAASAEQWERLVYSIRQQKSKNGSDTTPPIYAMDLLGFGHSEKPGVTYTQYLWESQLIDFAIEVMEAVPMVMAGNSIGGGLSAGAAASLGKKICRGLVLLNTAGLLYDPYAYKGFDLDTMELDSAISSHTEAAMEGNPEAVYKPVPIFGNKALDLFGTAIVGLIYPQIEERLSLIYGNRIENADPAVVYAIQQAAQHPGSSNVIGSGQKLAPNRPLNEVLMGVAEDDGESSFPTLVIVGLDDRVSSPQVAEKRADLFSRLSKLNPETLSLETIVDAGHCPHDEAPEKVASAMLNWLNSFGSSRDVGEKLTAPEQDSMQLAENSTL